MEPQDFAAATTQVRPSALREVALRVPAVKWTDVGGLDDVKAQLQEMVEWPQKHPEALARLGAKVCEFLLLQNPFPAIQCYALFICHNSQ